MDIFITRDLAPESPLRAWAEANGHTLTGRSFLRFAPCAFTPPEAADWWFFYSSRAVEFALPEGAEVPQAKLAAMGPGTATTLLSRAGRVDFTGGGTPKMVAEDFGRIAANQRVFFPRARQSRLTVQTLLADKITVLDAICYDNKPVPVTESLSPDVMIFTSPLNVSAYLDHQSLAARTQVQAIGPSTAGALREYGLGCAIAESPTELRLIELLEGI